MSALSVYDYDAVSKALRICWITGTSVLRTGHASTSLAMPFAVGRKAFYGEQLFSAMATGRFKTLDALGDRHLLNWRNQGFDVQLYIRDPRYSYPKFIVEIKTLNEGSFYELSPAQRREANVLAIFNPKYSDQTVVFEGTTYVVSKRSYRLIKLQ